MFYGSIVALVTPMHPDGTLDIESLRQLINWHMENQTDAFVILGTTGEAATIDSNERVTIIQQTLEEVDSRVPVIVGTGVNSTRATIALTQQAMELGADACLLVTPYYIKPTQEGLYQHFKAVAAAVAIPQILYNVPSRTACDLLPATVARLASITNIVGIKEATGDLARVSEILAQCKGKLDLFSGDDATALDFILAGGKGVISVTANVAPQAMHAMCAAALAGDEKQAKEINQKLMPLHKNLFVEANPIPAKWVLQEMGLIPSGIRLPLTVLSQEKRATVLEAMQQSGIKKI